ncbi:DUF6055 domain-containing protein [Mucilaginibacter sp. KACC 22063]|uniref:DUF6055 domain-containing protein n=1 Tax=Mucilaginibacter sp. KACC 22063 TaxID=3025666 RepID=UPI0023668006|nr:DUF6055 domain-containing protein [Mucilaginibacter sp. KACC 22063]WDF55847.1 DUF6055 domain-containing protein [Mucilaginibacter sp. KACC 22063]
MIKKFTLKQFALTGLFMFFMPLTQSCQKVNSIALQGQTGSKKSALSTTATTFANATGKQIYFPTYIWDGVANQYIVQNRSDYDNVSSRFCTSRSAVTDNFIIFWEAGYGTNPETAPDGYRVSMTNIESRLESMYALYRDSLKFVNKGSSLTDTYRMVVYLFYNKDFGTVYGSGSDDKVGTMLLYPSRLQGEPYGALAHELGHAFQYMVHCDGKIGFSDGTHWEMSSQYMLWRYYINWPIFESYHVNAFLTQTYLSFTHEDNQYHSPFVLEYWANKRGESFIGTLWNSAQTGDDFVMTYKRLMGQTQAAFNDEMFDACRRFITWDIDRDRSTMASFSNMHTSTLNLLSNGWLQIAATNAPQNYGYNGIRLNVPAANTVVTVNFKGLTSASGYNIINPSKAGWRYGFVAEKTDGTRVYSAIGNSVNGTKSFTVPANTSYLWLVAMGAPTEHWKHNADFNNANDEQWPYQIKLSGTTVNSSFIK